MVFAVTSVMISAAAGADVVGVAEAVELTDVVIFDETEGDGVVANTDIAATTAEAVAAEAVAAEAADAGGEAASDSEAAPDAEAGAGLSDLMTESGDFEIDEWLEGFDPDADFGGLGFDPATGPGEVRISVLDADGDYINGVVITEDGFRTDKATAANRPYEISQVPYGKRVYGVYLTYSFDTESVYMAKRPRADSLPEETVEVKISDNGNLPAVDVTDDFTYWEIVFTLRQSMKIKVSYFLVSPNDRFYYLRYDREDALSYKYSKNADESIITDGNQDINTIDSPADGSNTDESKSNLTYGDEAAAYHGYLVNAFAEAPVRVAVYVEMPAIKGVRAIRVSGVGFGNAGDEALDAGNSVAEDGVDVNRSRLRQSGRQWLIEGERAEFSMPDLTLTDRSCQLVSGESAIDKDNVTFIRYIVCTLPEAYEGARLKFESVSLFMEDGSEIVFHSPSRSDLTVQLVPVPRLL